MLCGDAGNQVCLLRNDKLGSPHEPSAFGFDLMGYRLHDRVASILNSRPHSIANDLFWNARRRLADHAVYDDCFDLDIFEPCGREDGGKPFRAVV